MSSEYQAIIRERCLRENFVWGSRGAGFGRVSSLNRSSFGERRTNLNLDAEGLNYIFLGRLRHPIKLRDFKGESSHPGANFCTPIRARFRQFLLSFPIFPTPRVGIFGINERFGQEKQVKSLGVCWNRLYEGIKYPFRDRGAPSKVPS